jgi:hypothetical protein
MIYNNVKAKQPAEIKQLMSEKTIGLAQAQAQRQNSPLEKIFENGFTATTFSPTMPEIRDERVSGDMGAIEVYNSQRFALGRFAVYQGKRRLEARRRRPFRRNVSIAGQRSGANRIGSIEFDGQRYGDDTEHQRYAGRGKNEPIPPLK